LDVAVQREDAAERDDPLGARTHTQWLSASSHSRMVVPGLGSQPKSGTL
jgi:hypothetical protein